MVSHAWFTVNYFHVSFGKHHDLGQHIQKLREIESISKKASKEEIQKQLVSSKKFEQDLCYNFLINKSPIDL